jgi:hypothetical protein
LIRKDFYTVGPAITLTWFSLLARFPGIPLGSCRHCALNVTGFTLLVVISAAAEAESLAGYVV